MKAPKLCVIQFPTVSAPLGAKLQNLIWKSSKREIVVLLKLTQKSGKWKSLE